MVVRGVRNSKSKFQFWFLFGLDASFCYRELIEFGVESYYIGRVSDKSSFDIYINNLRKNNIEYKI